MSDGKFGVKVKIQSIFVNLKFAVIWRRYDYVTTNMWWLNDHHNIFFENKAIDAFLACLFICSPLYIFVYGACIWICLMNIFGNWLIMMLTAQFHRKLKFQWNNRYFQQAEIRKYIDMAVNLLQLLHLWGLLIMF